MEPVLFYGVPSGCSLGSVIALEWLGQPYRLSRVEMLETPWEAMFAQVNPRMKTPALLTQRGEPLTESAAILQHIGQRGVAQGLGFAAGTLEFDRLAEMLSYLTTDLFAAFGPLWKLYDAGSNDPVTHQVLRQLGTDSVHKELGHLDAHLAGRTYLLGGDRPTVADAYLYAIGRWVEYHKVCVLADSHPQVHRYLAMLGDDPAVRFALDIEHGKAAAGNGGFQGHVTLQDLASRLAA